MNWLLGSKKNVGTGIVFLSPNTADLDTVTDKRVGLYLNSIDMAACKLTLYCDQGVRNIQVAGWDLICCIKSCSFAIYTTQPLCLSLMVLRTGRNLHSATGWWLW
jgi:hypothetical protein